MGCRGEVICKRSFPGLVNPVGRGVHVVPHHRESSLSLQLRT